MSAPGAGARIERTFGWRLAQLDHKRVSGCQSKRVQEPVAPPLERADDQSPTLVMTVDAYRRAGRGRECAGREEPSNRHVYDP